MTCDQTPCLYDCPDAGKCRVSVFCDACGNVISPDNFQAVNTATGSELWCTPCCESAAAECPGCKQQIPLCEARAVKEHPDWPAHLQHEYYCGVCKVHLCKTCDAFLGLHGDGEHHDWCPIGLAEEREAREERRDQLAIAHSMGLR